MSYYPTIEEDLKRAREILAQGKADAGDLGIPPSIDLGGTIYGADIYAAYKLLESFVQEIPDMRDRCQRLITAVICAYEGIDVEAELSANELVQLALFYRAGDSTYPNISRSAQPTVDDAELIRDLDQCPNPHMEKGAQVWRIGRRFRIICQFCAGCYSVEGPELAQLEARFGIGTQSAPNGGGE